MKPNFEKAVAWVKSEPVKSGIAVVVVIGLVVMLAGCAGKQIELDKQHNADLWADVEDCRDAQALREVGLRDNPTAQAMMGAIHAFMPCSPAAPTSQELAVRHAEIDAQVRMKWIDRILGIIGVVYSVERGGQFAVKAADIRAEADKEAARLGNPGPVVFPPFLEPKDPAPVVLNNPGSGRQWCNEGGVWRNRSDSTTCPTGG